MITMRRYVFITLVFFGALLPQGPAMATPEFAAKVGAPCATCHKDPEGGAELTAAGEYYKLNEKLPVAEAQHVAPLLPLGSNLRFLIGYLHIIIGVAWFGAIFYVHIIIGPRNLAAGLPKQERILGMGSLIGVGVTGTLLTLNKIHGLSDFTNSAFGIVLAIKIGLYLVMTTLAVITIAVLHKRLTRLSSSDKREGAGEISRAALADYNGHGDRPAYVAVGETVYDVSTSKMWKGGLHARRHQAGTDLSASIKESPHGPSVLNKFPIAGKLPKETEKMSHHAEPRVFKIFHTFAYINLIMALFILLCISFWRWGIPILGATR